jgi:asparagine synthase (glutamine-hydrolysing)
MSVQYGKWNFDGKPVDPKELDEIRPVLAPYGPDGEGLICKKNLAILYRAFHTSKESRGEIQPYVSKTGYVLTWDGRLDNREELLGRLNDARLSRLSTDLEIVAEAYERWRTDAFANVIGDWALSVWDPKDQSLILAKDFVGTRHLYYAVEPDRVMWCTILDPLVLRQTSLPSLDEEFIVGWISLLPDNRITPYAGIRSVPASFFVRIRKEGCTLTKYWDFDPQKRIRYQEDSEYEEHFRILFRESVRRRLHSDRPVLAELSGGMDSSSIVCIADQLIGDKPGDFFRLDSISYYDDTDPNWNERPYFTTVEETRGRSGLHINVAASSHLPLRSKPEERFSATPAHIGWFDHLSTQLGECLASNGNRIVLSGIGGDEITGGVPTPIPELSDLLVAGALQDLVKQVNSWALAKRKPWFHLLMETIAGFLPSGPFLRSTPLHSLGWLQLGFAKRSHVASAGYQPRLRVFGPRPSFQENAHSIDFLRRQLGCEPLLTEPLYEKRYPFLDRDLIEFFLAVPRNQVVRPGERRSLFRRSLAGIVPAKILQRRRKAYVASLPSHLLNQWCEDLAKPLVSEALGFVNSEKLLETLERAKHFDQVPLAPLLRTIALEYWLRCIEAVRADLLSSRMSRDPVFAASVRVAYKSSVS